MAVTPHGTTFLKMLLMERSRPLSRLKTTGEYEPSIQGTVSGVKIVRLFVIVSPLFLSLREG